MSAVALSHYAVAPTPDSISSLEHKALAIDILQKISYIALAAIVTFAFCVAYGALPLTSTVSALMMGAIPLALLIFHFAPQASHWAGEYAQHAAFETRVMAKQGDPLQARICCLKEDMKKLYPTSITTSLKQLDEQIDKHQADEEQQPLSTEEI